MPPPDIMRPKNANSDRVRATIAVATLFACAALGFAAEPARSAVAPPAVVAAARAAEPGERVVSLAAEATATAPAGPAAAPVQLTAQAITPDEANAPDGALGFTLRNPTTSPLPIAEIAVEEAMVTAGGVKSRLPAPAPMLACGFDPALKAPPFTLPPLRSCRVGVSLATAPAGKHEARVTVTGAAGGIHSFRLAADIKRGPETAILLIALGLIIGGIVTWWSGRGRERWGEAASVKAAMEMLEAQALSTTDPQPRLGGLAAAAADLQRRILAGEGHDPAEIGELWRRTRFVNFLLATERSAGGGAGQGVRSATTTAIAALAPGPEGRFDPAISESQITAAAQTILAARTGGIESADTAPPKMTLPINAAWSSAVLVRFKWLIEIAVSVALAIVFAAVALQSMYFNQPVWGSLTDLIAAFIIGFGAYAGSAASVDAFIAKAKKT